MHEKQKLQNVSKHEAPVLLYLIKNSVDPATKLLVVNN